MHTHYCLQEILLYILHVCICVQLEIATRNIMVMVSMVTHYT